MTENEPISLYTSPCQEQHFVYSAKYLRLQNETNSPKRWNCKLCFPYMENHGQQKHIKAETALIFRYSGKHYLHSKYITPGQIQTSLRLINSMATELITMKQSH